MALGSSTDLLLYLSTILKIRFCVLLNLSRRLENWKVEAETVQEALNDWKVTEKSSHVVLTLVRGTRPVPTAVEHCPTGTSTPDLDFYQVSVAVEPAYFFLQDNFLELWTSTPYLDFYQVSVAVEPAYFFIQDNNFLELCNLYTIPGLLPSIRSSGACLLLHPRQQLPGALQPLHHTWTSTKYP